MSNVLIKEITYSINNIKRIYITLYYIYEECFDKMDQIWKNICFFCINIED